MEKVEKNGRRNLIVISSYLFFFVFNISFLEEFAAKSRKEKSWRDGRAMEENFSSDWFRCWQ